MKCLNEKLSDLEFAAKKAGVKPKTLAKWTERGSVPLRNMFMLIEHSQGRLSYTDFKPEQ